MFIGQWPYQSAIVRRGLLAIIIVSSTTQLVPQMAAVIKNHDDMEFLLISATPLIFVVSVAVRLISSILNMHNVSYIFDEWLEFSNWFGFKLLIKRYR